MRRYTLTVGVNSKRSNCKAVQVSPFIGRGSCHQTHKKILAQLTSVLHKSEGWVPFLDGRAVPQLVLIACWNSASLMNRQNHLWPLFKAIRLVNFAVPRVLQ